MQGKATDRQFNTYDLLKLTAICLMFIDHAGYFFYNDIPTLRAIGRSAFPLFFFLIGYSGKFSISPNLIILTIAITIFNYLLSPEQGALGALGSTILPSIVIGKLIAKHLTKQPMDHLLINSLFLLLLTVPSWLLFQYGTFAPLFIISGFLLANAFNKKLQITFLLMVVLCYGLIEMNSYQVSDQIILFLSLTIMTFSMLNFRIVTLRKSKLNNLFKIIARNSLIIYIVHYEALKVITN